MKKIRNLILNRLIQPGGNLIWCIFTVLLVNIGVHTLNNSRSLLLHPDSGLLFTSAIIMSTVSIAVYYFLDKSMNKRSPIVDWLPMIILCSFAVIGHIVSYNLVPSMISAIIEKPTEYTILLLVLIVICTALLYFRKEAIIGNTYASDDLEKLMVDSRFKEYRPLIFSKIIHSYRYTRDCLKVLNKYSGDRDYGKLVHVYYEKYSSSSKSNDIFKPKVQELLDCFEACGNNINFFTQEEKFSVDMILRDVLKSNERFWEITQTNIRSGNGYMDIRHFFNSMEIACKNFVNYTPLTSDYYKEMKQYAEMCMGWHKNIHRDANQWITDGNIIAFSELISGKSINKIYDGMFAREIISNYTPNNEMLAKENIALKSIKKYYVDKNDIDTAGKFTEFIDYSDSTSNIRTSTS